MSFDDFLNNPIPKDTCDTCTAPVIRYLFHKPNGGIYKCCFSCLTAKSVSKNAFVGEITGEYEEFRHRKTEAAKKEWESGAKERLEKTAATIAASDDFHRSSDWRKVRFDILEKHFLERGHICLCCKRQYVILHVDHIKPRSKYPELALDPNNLQVLCEDCNIGKANRGETDFRGPGGGDAA